MNFKIKNLIGKKNRTKIVCLTAYSKNIASILEKSCDLILVGDSLANVLYGKRNTHDLSLTIMKDHALSVRLGAKKSLIVIDMPKGTYNNSKSAIKNAKYLIKQTQCDAIKIEKFIKKQKSRTFIERIVQNPIQFDSIALTNFLVINLKIKHKYLIEEE